MKERPTVSESGGMVRRYDYEDRSVVVADVGTDAGDLAVDVADGTAILVEERGDESRQREFAVPDGDVAKATITNGVVTVEVER